MDSDGDSIRSQTESEEDDYGCYFLQPSSTPYNITEKVQQANVDLFTSSPAPSEKISKVKFKEELVSFEPEDLTDDDVNSIESDHTELGADEKTLFVEYKTTVVSPKNLDIFDIDEVEEGTLVENEDYEEEVIEEVASDNDIDIPNTEQCVDEVDKEEPKQAVLKVDSSNKTATKSSKRKHSKLKALSHPIEVNCKEHCLEKLNFNLSMSIKKLEIHEKVQLPPLHLLQRKCCDEVKKKIPKNLPNYNGMRSEYGLTSSQLAKKEKYRELMKMREEMKQKLIYEYRNRKIQQNEEVFCQWLKEVARRKSEEKSHVKRQKPKECVTPNVITFPNKVTEKSRERPKTANHFVPKTCVKKQRRPHSTQSCVYIEVPKTVLEKGLNIGGLVVKNTKIFNKNNLHIVTIS